MQSYLLFAAALSASFTANAASFNFEADSIGDEDVHTSMVFNDSGITVTVTPGANLEFQNPPLVWQDVKGLGVTNAEDEDFRGELENEYSSDALGEYLTFTFDQWVTVGSIGFEDWVDSGHRAEISYGGGNAGSFIISGEGDIDDGDDIFSMAPLDTQGILWFTVTPLEEIGGGETDIYVYQIDNVTAVPIPAAVWLFGSALAGLGWMRRKQTATV